MEGGVGAATHTLEPHLQVDQELLEALPNSPAERKDWSQRGCGPRGRPVGTKSRAAVTASGEVLLKPGVFVRIQFPIAAGGDKGLKGGAPLAGLAFVKRVPESGTPLGEMSMR